MGACVLEALGPAALPNSVSSRASETGLNAVELCPSGATVANGISHAMPPQRLYPRASKPLTCQLQPQTQPSSLPAPGWSQRLEEAGCLASECLPCPDCWASDISLKTQDTTPELCQGLRDPHPRSSHQCPACRGPAINTSFLPACVWPLICPGVWKGVPRLPGARRHLSFK